MATATLFEMGKKPKEPKEPTETIRVPVSLIRRLHRLAGHRGLTVQDYLKEILPPVLKRDEDAMLGELKQELGDGRTGGGGKPPQTR